jgi:hypothetical protein
MAPVLAALTTAILLGAFAARHFSARSAVLAGMALLATMPMMWRALGDLAPQLVLLPFVILWLLAADRFEATGRWLWIGIAGALLALMIYAHRAGVVMAPVYAAVGAAALMRRNDHVVAVAAFIAGFAIVSAPWAIEWLRDPAVVATAVKAYGLYDADRVNVLQGMREMGSWVGLTARSEVYWDCFNPVLLFFDGVFLFPLAVPLVRGLYHYVAYPRGSVDWMVVGAFVASPFCAALLAQPPVPARLLLMAPVAAIISTRGCYPGAFRTSVAGAPPGSAISATTA